MSKIIFTKYTISIIIENLWPYFQNSDIKSLFLIILTIESCRVSLKHILLGFHS